MVYVDKVDTLFIKNASQGLCVRRRSREQVENNNSVLTDAWQVQDKGPDLWIQTQQKCTTADPTAFNQHPTRANKQRKQTVR